MLVTGYRIYWPAVIRLFIFPPFRPSKSLKEIFPTRFPHAGIRRSLVVFQFVLSIVLITSIIIIYSQLNYIKNKDLGFDKKQKLIFNFYTDEAQKKMASLTMTLHEMPEVKGVGMSNYYLGQFVEQDHGVYPPGGNMTTSIDAQNIATDEHFVKANGIQMVSRPGFPFV